MAITQAQLNAIEDGLYSALTDLQTHVGNSNKILNQDLPLVGAGFANSSAQAFQAIAAFREAIRNVLDDYNNNPNYTETAIQNAVNDALDNAGFGRPLSVNTSNGEWTFNSSRTHDFLDYDATVDTDGDGTADGIGIAGLPINIDGQLDFRVAYGLNFTVGADNTSGDSFYVRTDNDNLSLNINLTGANLGAELTLNGAQQFNATPSTTTMALGFGLNLVDFNNDGKLRISEMSSGFVNTTTSGLLDLNLSLDANLGSSMLPSFSFDLGVDWSFVADSSGFLGTAPVISFTNVELDFGDFVNNVIKPFTTKIVPTLTPIMELVDLLDEEIAFMKLLPGWQVYDLVDEHGAYGTGGDGRVTMLDFIKAYDLRDNEENIDLEVVATFIDVAENILSWHNFLTGNTVNAGGFSVGNFSVTSDIRDATFVLDSAGTAVTQAGDNLQNYVNSNFGSGSVMSQMMGAGSALATPILTESQSALAFLFGKHDGEYTDLIHIDLPKLAFSFGGQINSEGNFTGPLTDLINIPIPNPLGLPFTVEVEAALRVAFDLSFGYDTRGLEQYILGNRSSPALLANGFYLGDWNEDGDERPEIQLGAQINFGVGFGSDSLFKAFVGGAIEGLIALDLFDPEEDGKVYFDELASTFQQNPLSIFEGEGQITAGLIGYVTLLGGTVWEGRSDTITLGEFAFDSSATPQPPNLGGWYNDGVDFFVNVGGLSINRGIPNKSDGNEVISVAVQSNGDIAIVAFGKEDVYEDVTEISANFGNGNDVFQITSTANIAVNIDGEVGDDALFGGNAGDTLVGGQNKDLLVGAGGNDTLDGGEQDDTLEGGAGADTLIGGDGTGDIATYSGSNASVTINLMTGTGVGGHAQGDDLTGVENVVGADLIGAGDQITGDFADNFLSGLKGHDTLLGGGGADKLVGADGDDVLDGGSGQDTMVGGLGDDSYFVDQVGVNGDIVSESMHGAGGGRDAIISSVDINIEALLDIEDLKLVGNARVGEGNAVANLMIGTDRNDTLRGLGGVDELRGGEGNDTLEGGTESDTLKGEANNDTLDGGAGNDTLIGDNGHDTYIVDSQGDTITEANNRGTDTVQASVDYQVAAGVSVEFIATTNAAGTAALKLTGNEVAQTLTGNAGDNVLDGRGGADVHSGGAGYDAATYEFSTVAVSINRETGINTGGDAVGDTYDSTLEEIRGSNLIAASDFLLGFANAGDIFSGLKGDDFLYGFGGDDTLCGGEGKDTIDGGTGNDIMAGGAGDDTYYVDSLLDVVDDDRITHGTIGGGGRDIIYATLDYSLDTVERYDIEDLNLIGGARVGIGNGQYNVISGRSSNDTLDGRGGADLLRGLRGNDTYYFDAVNDSVEDGVNEGYDEIRIATGTISTINNLTRTLSLETSGANIEEITVLDGAVGLIIRANALDNIIRGNTASETIFGLAGNDTIYASGGADTIYGGEGDDTAIFTNVSQHDHFQGDNGIDKLVMDWSASIRDITLFTGIGDHWLRYDTRDAENNFHHTQFRFVERFDLTGGSGNDDLYGGLLDDVLRGGAGIDRLFGLQAASGNPLLEQTGKGTYDGGAGTDLLSGAVKSEVGKDFVLKLADTQAGEVVVNAGQVMETRWTGIEVVHLTTYGGNDTLDFRGIIANGRVIRDYVGNYLVAGEGNDTFAIDFGSKGHHHFNAEGGTDLLVMDWSTSAHNITLFTGVGDHWLRYDTSDGATAQHMQFRLVERFDLTGGSGNDDLYGGSLDDVMRGGAGIDRLFGFGLSTNPSTEQTGKGSYNGGAGTDWVRASVKSTATDHFSLALNATQSAERVSNLGQSMETRWSGVEFVDLTTYDGNDTLDGRGIVANGRDVRDLAGNFFTSGEGNDTFAIDFGSKGHHHFNAEGGTDLLVMDWSASTRDITLFTGIGDHWLRYDTRDAENVVQHAQFRLVERFDLTGGSGNDDLYGGSLDDVMRGGAGIDRLFGFGLSTDPSTEQAGKGSYNGGAGTDWVRASVKSTTTEHFSLALNATQSAEQVSNLGQPMETRWSGVEFVDLTTYHGNDTLDARGIVANGRDVRGVSGNSFTSGTGDDTFAVDFGSKGHHHFNAEGGTDLLLMDWSASTHNITLFTGTGDSWLRYDTRDADNVVQHTQFRFVERFDLTGGSGNDDLYGGLLDDVLRGGAGIDRLFGLQAASGNPLLEQTGKGTYDGGAGTDLLSGAVKSEVGKDFVLKLADTQAGEVVVNAGQVMETRWTGIEVVHLTTYGGNDTLDFRGIIANGRVIRDYVGNYLVAGEGNDTFAIDFGSKGHHHFNAEGGTDLLVMDWSTSAHNITLFTGVGDHWLRYDTSDGATAQHMQFRLVERFDLTGGSGNDDLYGGSLDDVMRGGAGIDRLFGFGLSTNPSTEQTGKGSYNGGAGTDWVRASVKSTATDHFSLALNATQSAERVSNLGQSMETRWSGVEFVDLTTYDGNDTLDGRGIVANGRDVRDLAGNFFTSGEGNDTFAIDFGSKGHHHFNAEGGTDLLVMDWSASTRDITLFTGVGDHWLRYDTSDGATAQHMQFRFVERFDLTGGSGNDDLIGGVFADTLRGGAGIDRLYGYDWNAQPASETAGGVYDGGAGADYARVAVQSTAENSFYLRLVKSQGANVIVNRDEAMQTTWRDVEVIHLTTYAGDDMLDTRGVVADGRAIRGHAGHFFTAGNGDDTFAVDFGNKGHHHFDGQGGVDTLILDWSASTHNITLFTGVGDSWLRYDTSDGATPQHMQFRFVERFQLTGGAGADTLYGGSLNDVLNGGVGADRLEGYAGDDIYGVDNLGDQVIEGVNGGDDLVSTAISYTLSANVERLTLGGNNAINGTGNDLNNTIIGNKKANTIDGRVGADTMEGGAGNDLYYVDNVGDVITEGLDGGYDTVYSTVTITGPKNVEVIGLISGNIDATGNVLDNNMIGSAGNNVLNGGKGADRMEGRGGDDTYSVDDAGDTVVEVTNGGTDIVFSGINYTLTNFVENLTLYGSASTATGNGLANVLVGNNGGNTIWGGAGNDKLHGALGNDTLRGEAGADRFVFDTALHFRNNYDTIDDFEIGIDKIELSQSIFGDLAVGALAQGAFVAGASAGDADDRIIYTAATGTLAFDADGNGAGGAVRFAVVTPGLALTHSDFMVV